MTASSTVLETDKQELRASGLFDEAWYCQSYPDVAQSGIEPAEHYLWIGARLGRRPGPGVSFADVARTTPAQPTAGQNAAARQIAASAASKFDQPETVLRAPLPDIDDPLPISPPSHSRWIANTAAIARNRPRSLAPLTRSFNPCSLNLHWIVPAFGPGGGGHMSIFRMIRWLETFGHRQTIWLQNPQPGLTEQDAYQQIRDWYQPIDRVIVRFLPENVEGISGDAVIATDMWTPFAAANMPLFKERYYLVQDYEALFHIHGTYSYLADLTYGMGFKVVCAGAWLRQLMESKFGLWARDWALAYDPAEYFTEARAPRLAVPRIAFYARQSTPRRAVELAREALIILHDRGIAFSVDMFGQDDLGPPPPYAHVHHGLLTPRQLGELYRTADIGLVFSATNYSLIPIEMMACGLPVVELETESTQAVFPPDAVCLAPPNPHDIANTIEGLICDPGALQKLRESGLDWVGGLSWEKSARALEAGLIEGLCEANEPVRPEQLFLPAQRKYKAAVIIPTWNGGAFFRDVLQAVVEQETAWPFEVLVIDSGSTDETPAIIREFSDRGVRFHTIPNSEFQHGRTRNLAISLTDSEFVAVITQDARPLNRQWLANLVSAFDAGPRIAGVFGAHSAHPDASSFVREGLEGHFRHFDALPHVANWYVDLPPSLAFGSLGWQQWLHYFSDNNACLRRSVWDKIPYPEIPWAEDQVWAWEIIKQGYEKAYAPDAIVAHSHNLTSREQLKVSRIEGDLWLRYFGYRFEGSSAEVEASIAYLNARDSELARVRGIVPSELSAQFALNQASVKGRYLGQAGLLEALRRYHTWA